MKWISSFLNTSVTLFKNRKRGTVRTTFSMMGIAALLGAAVINSGNASYVRLQSSLTTVEAGERFSIDVFAYAHVPVNAIDITIEFEPNSVQVLAVDRGQSVLTIWTEDPKINRDSVVLRGGTFRNGFLGEHKIATIDLVARQTGKSEFIANDILLLAGDGAGTAVQTTNRDKAKVSLFIYDENTDPSDIGVSVKIAIITDINGDGRVSLTDISAFMASWGSLDQIYDFNGDGRMTFRDFSIILADYFLQ